MFEEYDENPGALSGMNAQNHDNFASPAFAPEKKVTDYQANKQVAAESDNDGRVQKGP